MHDDQPDVAQLRSILRGPDQLERRQTIRYTSGRSLTLLESPGDDRLTIASPSGRIELSVRFTADGPVLEFDSDTVTLRNPGSLELECERFRVRAKQGVEIASDAEIRMRGEGNVHIDGENLMLNCETRPHTLVPRG